MNDDDNNRVVGLDYSGIGDLLPKTPEPSRHYNNLPPRTPGAFSAILTPIKQESAVDQYNKIDGMTKPEIREAEESFLKDALEREFADVVDDKDERINLRDYMQSYIQDSDSFTDDEKSAFKKTNNYQDLGDFQVLMESIYEALSNLFRSENIARWIVLSMGQGSNNASHFADHLLMQKITERYESLPLFDGDAGTHPISATFYLCEDNAVEFELIVSSNVFVSFQNGDKARVDDSERGDVRRVSCIRLEDPVDSDALTISLLDARITGGVKKNKINLFERFQSPMPKANGAQSQQATESSRLLPESTIEAQNNQSTCTCTIM